MFGSNLNCLQKDGNVPVDRSGHVDSLGSSLGSLLKKNHTAIAARAKGSQAGPGFSRPLEDRQIPLRPS